ncbi:response regulator [Pelomonas sp. APW6]|uniref:Response regulator n=1 Tax=Roseateles subflavus TaxID=3053353 RepID=A0ABT7LBR1_9BURK|nr:response regulator [Pelomonas sp. APW6]MDL5030306.1 response regulator [Pelomonas sp. APW6]
MSSHSPPALPAPLAVVESARRRGELVLIVDDVPDNLALLHEALEEWGYTVLVALDGAQALRSAEAGQPDIILLDAVMPGMDGFEVARRLKAQVTTQDIPLIFMTGLTETEHLEAALACGACDYVTKPLKPREVLARMQAQLRGAQASRGAGHARRALDAFGYASATVRLPDGRLLWATPLARALMARYDALGADHVAPGLRQWLLLQAQAAVQGQDVHPLHLDTDGQRLTLRVHQCVSDEPAAGAEGTSEWLLVMQERSDAALIQTLVSSFRLTQREAEVLFWVAQGKINRDIADILGASPATVKKHLERIHAKLGVETRTAAAALALGRLRQQHPQAAL